MPSVTENVYDEGFKFLEEDYKSSIEKFHKSVKMVNQNVENSRKNFDEVIRCYSDKEKVLFYSDSPYVSTSDYADDANGVEPFMPNKDMENLIDLLAKSEQKFIFSCRASQGSVNGSKINDKLVIGNYRICMFLFEYFIKNYIDQRLDENNKCKLSVLVIIKDTVMTKKKSTFSEQADTKQKKLSDLEILLEKNMLTEIMITNYKIVPLPKYKNYRFEVYSFEEVLRAMINKLNLNLENPRDESLIKFLEKLGKGKEPI